MKDKRIFFFKKIIYLNFQERWKWIIYSNISQVPVEGYFVRGYDSMQNVVKNTIEIEATHNVNVLKCADKNLNITQELGRYERFIWTCCLSYLKLKWSKHNIKKAIFANTSEVSKLLLSLGKYCIILDIHVSCWNRYLKLHLVHINYIV